MTRNKMLAVLLAGLILIGFAGCGTNTEPIENSISSQTASADATSDNDTGDDVTAKIKSADETDNAALPEEPIAEKESNALQSSKSADTKNPVSSAPVKNEIPNVSKPCSAKEPVQTEKAQSEAAIPVNPPAAPPPAEQKPSEPEPIEPPAPQFDIDYWVSYAQNYAANIGLRLERSAVDCWDNPIIADAHCVYLERDIQSRLNRYNRDEDITDVWIWAESRSDGSYDLYIGYA